MQCLGTVNSTRINRAARDRHATLHEKFQNFVLDKRCVRTDTSELICYLQNDKLCRNVEMAATWMTQILGMKQVRQCTYNLTLRHVSEIIVVKEKRWVLHILTVCNLRYPACNAHAPYCHLWPLWPYLTLHITSLTVRLSKKRYST
jgi:hypothetical protein